ncbi:MAG: Maf family nucleotide pyrophosphatase [Methylococcaceae bacterium]|nr:Maf family nucleotide pyrophosphatase [Methylococcaceae bacterium]
MPEIILASASQYRAELLRKLHLDFISCGSNVDETPLPGESPELLAKRLSQAKAEALSAMYPNHLIVGSDQVAVCGNELLSKPGDRTQAIRQLKMQSGQTVRFYTGICVLNSATGHYLNDIDICSVHFKTLSDSQIERYVDLEKPFDCAGSFKSEGLGIALFSRIEGDDPNALVGLPLIKLTGLLARFGIDVI